MSRQIAFSLPPRALFARADFFVTPANSAALGAVESQSQPGLLLIGPPGSGKTHLAHIAAAHHRARILGPDAVAAALPALSPQARIVVDDIDHATAASQSALFHLYNLITPAGRLIVTATTPPRDWPQALPDLASRLQTLTVARLDPPDDTLIAAVLIKLFADHQIIVPPNLIAYLLPRMERSIAAARSLVAALDARGLAEARPITRALAAEVLDNWPRQ